MAPEYAGEPVAIDETVGVVRVRAARKSELPLIEEVFLRSARRGWQGIFDEERLNALAGDGLPEWTLEGVSVLVAPRGADILGFASFGPAYGEDDQRSLAKLYRLFVRPEDWGDGIGDTLLAASIDLLRGAGFAEAVLWVGEANTGARRFYEHRGWKLDGTRRSREFLGADFPEVRYRVVLARTGSH
jgi:GNAT superfamily N-acetyltransferase